MMIHPMQCSCSACAKAERHRTDRRLRAVYIIGGLALIAMLLFG